VGSIIALVVGLAAVLLAMVLPRRYGLAIALVVFVVLPRFIYAENSFIQGIPPFGWVVAVWLLRTLRNRAEDLKTRKQRNAMVAFLIVSLGWYVATLTWSINPLTSLGWIVPFILGVVMVAIGGRDADSLSTLRTVWLWTAGLMALYGIAEFLLESNPVYDYIRQLLSSPLVRTWSVYRVNASFGHPLYAALFYSMSAAFAFGWGIMQGKKWALVVAAVSGLATVLTVSRGGIAVLAVALVAISSIAIFRQTQLRLFGKVAISMGLIVAGVAVFQIPQLQERLFSAEALSSVAARQSLDTIIWAAAENSRFVGSGIGTSTAAAFQFNPEAFLIENAYYQLFISAGIAGVALFALIIVVATLRALRQGDLAGLGLTLTFGIMVASFNGVESNPGILFLLGLALAHVYGARSVVTEAPETLGENTVSDPAPVEEPRRTPDDVSRAFVIPNYKTSAVKDS